MVGVADRESGPTEGVERTYATFLIAGKSFAVDVGLVKEIIKSEELVSLEEPSPDVEGFIEHYSMRIPVLNTRRILSLDSPATNAGVMIVNIDGFIFGLTVDIDAEMEIFSSVTNPKPLKGSEPLKAFVEGTINVSGITTNVLALSNLISKKSRERFFAKG